MHVQLGQIIDHKIQNNQKLTATSKELEPGAKTGFQGVGNKNRLLWMLPEYTTTSQPTKPSLQPKP